MSPVNFQLDIERAIVQAIKDKVNLHDIANILREEAEAQIRLARIVREVQGSDTWP